MRNQINQEVGRFQVSVTTTKDPDNNKDVIVWVIVDTKSGEIVERACSPISEFLYKG